MLLKREKEKKKIYLRGFIECENEFNYCDLKLK